MYFTLNQKISNFKKVEHKAGKSWVWKYSEIIPDKHIRCQILHLNGSQCKKIFSLTISTQSIASHLTQCHQINENTNPDTISTHFRPVKNLHPTIKTLFENNDKQPYNKKKQDLMYDLVE